MTQGLNQQKLAVQSGLWPLLRYDPRLIELGQNPLSIDSKDPTIQPQEYMYNETRYRMLVQSDEARAEMLLKAVKKENKKRLSFYRQMADMHYNGDESNSD
jgi:pyruvate-ferredoxin/flavodoxin oxidoreductase